MARMVDEKCIAVWCGNLRESYHLEDLGVNGKIKPKTYEK